MKLRSGFVSNSSSSSFILILDQIPSSVDELIEMLDFSGASASFTKEQYAERVLKDINGDEPGDDELRSLLRQRLYCSVMGNYWIERDNDRREALRRERESRLEKATDDELAKFKKRGSGKVVRVISYSDNDGEFFCNLEHGGLFGSIPHVYVNQH